MSVAFHHSQDSTIGMEMEFQLVDANKYSLVNGVLPLLESFRGEPHIKSEFILNTVEVASEPCARIRDLEENLHVYINKLIYRARGLGMKLCGAGTHPFSKKLALITPFPRYLAMEKISRHISHTQITYATHVHVSVPSGDESILLMSELKPYLPILIALSANSPYWRGYQTGFASYRQRILASARSYGLPPDFSSWRDFETFLASSIRAGMYESIHDIHWDVRPRPHFGTIEVRIMDAQSTVRGAIRLAAFIRALVHFLQTTREKTIHQRPLLSLPWWAPKDNCFCASRYGMESQQVIDAEGGVAPLRELVLELLRILPDYAEDEYERSLVDELLSVVEAPPYEHQLSIAERGSLPEVVQELAQELITEGEPVCG